MNSASKPGLATSYYLLLLVLLVACTNSGTEQPSAPPPPPNPPVDRTWHSEHFQYHSHGEDESVCEGVVDVLERHFVTLQAYLDFEWPASKQVSYYKYTNGQDLRDNGSCSDFNAACFFAGIGVQTYSGLHTHELVHAYLEPLGRRHVLLEEGLAQALSCGASVTTLPDPPAVDEAFAARSWQSNDLGGFRSLYQTSQWFVGWLLAQYGPERFMRWYDAMRADADYPTAAKSFRSVYAADLDATWQTAFTSDLPDAGCVRVWECASDSFEGLPIAVGCDQAPAVKRFELERASWVAQQSQGGGLLLGSCGQTPAPAHQAWLREASDGHAGDAFAVWLEPGRYFVAQSPLFARGSLELVEASPPGPLGECDATTPLSFDFVASLTIGLHLGLAGAAGEGGELAVSWVDTSPRGRGYEIQCEPGTDATWCNSCDDCDAICDSSVAIDPEQPNAVFQLRLRSDSAGAHSVRITRDY